jgi:hypothetical protein
VLSDLPHVSVDGKRAAASCRSFIDPSADSPATLISEILRPVLTDDQVAQAFGVLDLVEPKKGK